MAHARIKAIDQTSVHRITSSQVVVDLQTAIKELVENALDAGATAVDVRIKENGVKSVEVIDNGSGIAKEDYETVALKHHTSKLSTFEDLTTVETFGFRGEALASLCAMCESVVITTATSSEAPMGTVLELDRSGRVLNQERRVARQRGTTVLLTGLFTPLPVRRKEFERHAKREYGKALNLLTAYALVPCAAEATGVKLTVSHISDSGKKSVQIQTDGSTSLKSSVSALWGSRATENIVPLNLVLNVEPDSASLKRRGLVERNVEVKMSGLVSKFAVGCGRTSNDRQFFFVNKRPCNLPKIQKAFNEVYKTFNAAQSPFIVVDFTLPTDACDINVSPDKRTIFLHSEQNLIEAMKAALEDYFNESRSEFTIQPSGATTTLSDHPTRASRTDTVSSPDPRPPSPKEATSIPSSDPPPSIYTSTPPIPSSDSGSAKEALNLATSAPQTGPSAPTISSSRLRDHMSPSPLTEVDAVDEGLKPASEPSRKRPASRSPSASPVRPVEAVIRPKRPVQMVLNTTGASWSLNTGDKEPPGKVSRQAPFDRLNEGRKRASEKKGFSSIQATLSQFRRGNDAKMVSEEEDEVAEDRPSSGEDQEKEVGTNIPVNDKEAREERGRSASRSSRSSMRIDSPPDTPEKMPGTPVDRALMDEEPPNTGLTGPESWQPPTARIPLLIAPEEDGTVRDRPEEIIKDWDTTIMPMKFDMEAVTLQWKEAPSRNRATRRSAPKDTARVLGNQVELDVEPNSNPEEVLSRVIRKKDFETMEILGQFNLGFIIVRSRRSREEKSGEEGMDIDEAEKGAKGAMIDDLFIVDQHAADEKYNFETLQQTTRIESQKLFRAQPLDFSASDRVVAVENLDVLLSNGFEVEVSGQGEGEEHKRGGQILLVSKPVSKSTVFDMSDLVELLHLMQDKPTGTMVRCSKARAMFASRACRKSVMVGDPLSRAQMTSIIRHMSSMDQPWNCPHGRPTMRHLLRTNTYQPIDATRRTRKVNWGEFQ